MRAVRLVATWSLTAIAIASCKPDFGVRDSLVTSTRVIAVVAEPPEAAAGGMVTFTAVVVGPNGTIGDEPVGWAFCASPKSLSEDDIVSRACLDDSGVRAVGGPAQTVSAAIPADACSLFGSEPPPGSFRAHDPDVTGGYYQPMRLELTSAPPSFSLERISCHLANAPTDAASAFGMRYVANTNPHLAPLVATIGGAATSLAHVPAGARVTLTASWPPGDAEGYVSFDLGSQSLIDRREAMRVSWYATAGDFDSDHTGRDESDHGSSTDDAWTAPSSPGVVHLWIVLRDSRGGLDAAAYDVVVE